MDSVYHFGTTQRFELTKEELSFIIKKDHFELGIFE